MDNAMYLGLIGLMLGIIAMQCLGIESYRKELASLYERLIEVTKENAKVGSLLEQMSSNADFDDDGEAEMLMSLGPEDRIDYHMWKARLAAGGYAVEYDDDDFDDDEDVANG